MRPVYYDNSDKPVYYDSSCNNVAPVTNLCLGRAKTRSHSSQWRRFVAVVVVDGSVAGVVVDGSVAAVVVDGSVAAVVVDGSVAVVVVDGLSLLS
jgi:hypothetical protein